MDAKELKPCAECGMPCEPREYHPFAACLLFKQTYNSTTVRQSLMDVMLHGRRADSDAAQAPTTPVELLGVADELKNGGGFWRTCSGCYECECGQPVGHYEHSAILNCDLGSGCAECGGVGAVWDNTDYEAMAAAFDAEEIAREQAEEAQAPIEMSPEFTDSARAALRWVLYHHQGGSSPIGQPIRFALGMGSEESLNAPQIGEALKLAKESGWEWAREHDLSNAAPGAPAAAAPLTDEQREAIKKAALLLKIFAGHDSGANLLHHFGKDWHDHSNKHAATLRTILVAAPAPPVAADAAAPTPLGSPAEGHWGEPEAPSDGHRLESDVDEDAQPDEDAAYRHAETPLLMGLIGKKQSDAINYDVRIKIEKTLASFNEALFLATQEGGDQ